MLRLSIKENHLQGLYIKAGAALEGRFKLADRGEVLLQKTQQKQLPDIR